YISPPSDRPANLVGRSICGARLVPAAFGRRSIRAACLHTFRAICAQSARRRPAASGQSPPGRRFAATPRPPRCLSVRFLVESLAIGGLIPRSSEKNRAMRLPALLVLVVLSACLPVAEAAASGGDVIADCTKHGTLTKHYSQREYRQALASLPADVDEYGDCRNVIKDAQVAAAASTGSRKD